METENSVIDFRRLMNISEYDPLRIEKRLGNRIILPGLRGSYACGTCNKNSDIDFREVTLDMPSDLIGFTEFKQYEDTNTDTVTYSSNKTVRLLLDCNPNTCEILDLGEDQYLIKSKLDQELLDHKGILLSKRAVKSFGGHVGAQLGRLQNATVRGPVPQIEKEQHVLQSVRSALEDFKRRYPSFSKGSIRLYIGRSENPELETEIYMDADYRHMPLRDYESMRTAMHSVVKNYNKIDKHNRKKDDNHLNEHAMHSIRLFMMAVDISEKGEVNTNRRHDLDLLMKVYSGGFRKEDGTFDSEFYDILTGFGERLQTATRESMLPDNPDMEKVGTFVEYVNRRSIEGDY